MIITKKSIKSFGVLMVLGSLLLLTACGDSKLSRKDKVAAMVGMLQDPFMSVTFTPKVLMDKSGVQDGALPFTYEAFATFFMNEKKTGVDNNGQVQIVVENSGGMIPNGYVFIPLENSSNFRNLVEKELGANVQEKDGAHYFRKDDDNYVVAWKDDIAILSNIPVSLDNLFSKGTNESKKAAIGLVNLLNGISKGNINEEFRTFFDKEGDVLLHANGETAYQVIDGMRFISKRDKANYKSLLDGTMIETALNFENGSIQLQNNYSLADSLKSYFKILKTESVDADMLRYGLTADPVMGVSLNFSLSHLVNVLKKQRDMLDTDDLEDDLSELNIKLEDLPRLFNGEIVMMVDAVETVQRSYTGYNGEEHTYESQEPKFLSVFGLKDTESVEELIASSIPDENQTNKIDGDVFYLIKDDKLFFTNSEDWFAAVKNGTTVAIQDANKALSSKAIGLYVSPGMGEKLPMDLDELELLKDEMTDFIVKAGEEGVQLTIKLKDANKNALRSILEQMVEEYDKYEKINHSKMNDVLNDELMETIETEVESTVEDIINSEELQNVQEALEAL